MKLYVLLGYFGILQMETLIGVFESMEKLEDGKEHFLNDVQEGDPSKWDFDIKEMTLNEVEYEILSI